MGEAMANLIAYYSRKGENYWAGDVRVLEKGNTERVAEFVQQAVGGDLFEIETVKEYAADYYRCIDEAKAELKADARPELARYLEDAGLSTDDYDTIFLGYPNWWGTYPMCVFTFLDRCGARWHAELLRGRARVHRRGGGARRRACVRLRPLPHGRGGVGRPPRPRRPGRVAPAWARRCSTEVGTRGACSRT